MGNKWQPMFNFLSWLYFKHVLLFSLFLFFSKICQWLLLFNPADGSNAGLHAPPLSVPPVFAPLKQVLAPPVVWVLKEDPGSFEHLARVDIVAFPVLGEGRQVVCHLHRLTFKVWLFPNFQLPWIPHLEGTNERMGMSALLVSYCIVNWLYTIHTHI